jgi:hypothetical protein
MYVFKKKHASDPDKIYKRISYSASIHKLLNIIEDFEISNKRYSAEDKNIVRNMTLNGELIGGLVTEDDRGWEKMSLEQMYEELSNELIAINSAIRSDPAWQPKTKQKSGKTVYDAIELSAGQAAAKYKNIISPSGIQAPLDVFIKSKTFKGLPKELQDLVMVIYSDLKDYTDDSDKQKLLDTIKDIANSGIQETFVLVNPIVANVICELYTPEEKMIASDIIKNLIGNINYKPQKFNIKRKNNSQEYKDAWNTVIKQLDSSKFDDETLKKLRDIINNA